MVRGESTRAVGPCTGAWGGGFVRGEPEVQSVSVERFGLEGRVEELDVAMHEGRGQGRRFATEGAWR